MHFKLLATLTGKFLISAFVAMLGLFAAALSSAGIASDIAAFGTLVTAAGVIVTAILSIRSTRRLAALHEEVKTGNTKTIGLLSVETEGRRIQRDIPRAERTSDEQHYADQAGRGSTGTRASELEEPDAQNPGT